MTSLLTRPDTARADAARPRPLVLIATLGGVSAALAPLVVLLAVGVIGWFVTDAGVHGAPRDGMRMGALAWLAGHGSGFTVMGARVTIVPLGVTAMTVWSMWRLGHRVGDAVSGHGPDADRISDGERDLTVPIAIMTFFAGYAVVAVVVATLAAGTSVDPSVPRVLAWTVVMTALVAAPAIAVGSGRAAIWATFVPVTVRAGAAVAGAVLGTLLAVSTLAFLVTFAMSLDDAATMTSSLHPSPAEAGLYALVNAAFVPNAALFTGSFLLGPGFAVGGATLVTPGAVVLGPLPVVPLFAALPAVGTPAAWVGSLMLLPPCVAAVAAYRTLRTRTLDLGPGRPRRVRRRAGRRLRLRRPRLVLRRGRRTGPDALRRALQPRRARPRGHRVRHRRPPRRCRRRPARVARHPRLGATTESTESTED